MSASIPKEVEETWNKIMDCKKKTIVIQGCAGSRKTDLIVQYAKHHLFEKRDVTNCLFLTMVNSVADEICQRLSTALGITFSRHNNHLLKTHLGKDKQCTIEISSFDAFIHCQLDILKDPMLFQKAVFYEWKAERLLDAITHNQHNRFIMKTGIAADLVIVDECQDLDPIRMKIITGLLQKTKNVRFVACGDLLQSIFDHGTKNFDEMPFSVLQSELKPSFFRIYHCFRCPPEHIRFVNRVLQDVYKEYNMPPMNSVRPEGEGFRPWLIPVGNISSRHGCHQNAMMISDIIEALVEEDASVHIRDIAVLNKRVNDQPLFHHIMMALQRKGIHNIHIAHTKGQDAVHQPIDWEVIRGNIVMISVHGDKGKGHQVVFFFGATNQSFPDIRHPSTWRKIFSDSLLDVALTRSTRHLFIGVPSSNISPYFTHVDRHEMRRLASCLWEPPMGVARKGLSGVLYNRFYTICKKYAETPVWDTHQRTKPVRIPRLPMLYADHNVLRWLPDVKIEKVVLDSFKKTLCGFHQSDDEQLSILRVITELMILRAHKRHVFLDTLGKFRTALSESEVLFTTDQGLLAVAEDVVATRRFYDIDKRIYEHFCMPEINNYLRKMSLPVLTRPCLILPSVFDTPSLRRVLDDMLDESIKNSEIHGLTWWRGALLWEELDSDVTHHRSRLNVLWDSIRVELDDLHNMVHEFHMNYTGEPTMSWEHTLYRLPTGRRIREMNSSALLRWQFDTHLDERIFRRGFEYGMMGRSDFYHKKRKAMSYIVMSNNDFQPEWFGKCLFNMCQLSYFNNIHGRIIQIFNPNRGYMYKIKIPKDFDRKQFLVNILDFEGFDDDMKNEIMTVERNTI